jgi:SAM-dependent methyltransferase
MNDDFSNAYDDDTRAASYAKLEYPGSYYLAFRDIPSIIKQHVRGTKALDFGCGTGRSTRFLHGLGFDAVGIDISEPMLERARGFDPGGRYRLVPDGNLDELEPGAFDLILSAFTFDNIPTMDKKVSLFTGLKRALSDNGCIVSIVSSPEIYVNEWASFSTKDFPENREAKSGDTVKIIMLDVDDRRPVEDIIWTDAAYDETFFHSGLKILDKRRPLGASCEAIQWKSEIVIAPWVVYVLGCDVPGGSAHRHGRL